MKSIFKPALAFSFVVLSMSACSFGDKGDESVADSVRLDTTQVPAMNSASGQTSSGSDSGAADTTGLSQSNINTTLRDSVSKNRSANGGADGVKQSNQEGIKNK
jgi:hypothetical protein